MSALPRALRSARALPLVLGVIHFVVDASTVSVALGSAWFHGLPVGETFVLVLTYDMLAFATQSFLGAAIDRLRWMRAALLAGLVLAAASVALLPLDAMTATVVAGLGNALFHVGAGAMTLCVSRGRAAPNGVFVAPGALGLALGVFLGRGGHFVLWPFLVALVLSALAALALTRPSAEYADLLPERGPPPLAPPTLTASDRARAAAVALLLLSITVRSAVGYAGSYRCEGGVLTLAGLGVAAFAGKALGGIVADRVGWVKASVGALLVSAPLIAFGGTHRAVIVLGMFVFQMTMPVTLAALFVAYPRRPAFAFGIACLALVLGVLPTFVSGVTRFYSGALLLALILASAASVYAGLRLLGLTERVLPQLRARVA